MADQSAAMARAVTPEQALDAALVEMDRPFVRGAHDCCSAACLAFGRLWGVPVWPLVPEYRTRTGALRLIRSHGGPEAWCADLARRAGLHERAPHVGALGLYAGGEMPITLALCVGDAWASMAEGGGVVFRPDVPVMVRGI